MSEASSMSFASSYVLASKVRSKLTKQAANPKSSLRSLVLQANMLDNIMDHISTKTEQMKREKSVSFSTPEPASQHKYSAITSSGPSVTEYEIESDSDSDFDSESDSDDVVEEDEDDWYYSSDSESEDGEDLESLGRVVYAQRNIMPVIDLSDDDQLSVIFEENEEDALPELTHSISSSDSESEEDLHVPNYILSTAHANSSTDSLLGTDISSKEIKSAPVTQHHHHRHDAICSFEEVF
ncbi:hypothetical protein OXX80_011151 [Metschnikowia pulcherrima]